VDTPEQQPQGDKKRKDAAKLFKRYGRHFIEKLKGVYHGIHAPEKTRSYQSFEFDEWKLHHLWLSWASHKNRFTWFRMHSPTQRWWVCEHPGNSKLRRWMLQQNFETTLSQRDVEKMRQSQQKFMAVFAKLTDQPPRQQIETLRTMREDNTSTSSASVTSTGTPSALSSDSESSTEIAHNATLNSPMEQDNDHNNSIDSESDTVISSASNDGKVLGGGGSDSTSDSHKTQDSFSTRLKKIINRMKHPQKGGSRDGLRQKWKHFIQPGNNGKRDKLHAKWNEFRNRMKNPPESGLRRQFWKHPTETENQSNIELSSEGESTKA
jgi:hypothetical protein